MRTVQEMPALILALLIAACATPGANTAIDTSMYATASVTLTCERTSGGIHCSVSTSAEITQAVP